MHPPGGARRGSVGGPAPWIRPARPGRPSAGAGSRRAYVMMRDGPGRIHAARAEPEEDVDELRRDPTRGRWVLIRPKAVPPAESGCPYCPGAEAGSKEIAAYRKDGSAPNTPGWSVRVVPAADPYFRIEHELVREGVGMFDMITPRGASELIIESPRHEDTLASMEPEQIESVLWMYRDRLLDLKRDNQIRDILVSRRYRKPGVPPHHPYSR